MLTYTAFSIKSMVSSWTTQREILACPDAYIKLLDFIDLAVQAANSRVGPFASRFLNLTQ